jgi:hypothetical protein
LINHPAVNILVLKTHMMSECKWCKLTKVKDEFDLQYYKGKPCEKRRSVCRECRRIRRKTYGVRSGEGLRDYNLKRLYGISLKDFKKMLLEQNHKCYLCNGTTKNRWGYGLAVDHCHKSGKVRKLLCDKCNKGLGQFNDDSELLIKAAKYLKDFS